MELIDLNRSIFVVLGSVSLLSACVSAQQSVVADAPMRADDASPSSDEEPVMRAAYAILIGKQGEESSDATALRTAVQTLAGLGAKPETGQGDDLTKRWAEQARLIDPTTTLPVYRGRALGPSYKKGMVSAVSTVSTDQIFLAGKKASVALVPVSFKPMSISISDGQGKNICNRSTSSKPANCRWLPLFTERYRIDIHTSASQPVTYYLVSN